MGRRNEQILDGNSVTFHFKIRSIGVPFLKRFFGNLLDQFRNRSKIRIGAKDALTQGLRNFYDQIVSTALRAAAKNI